ncbi:hypothetical protein F66182_6653 [Fusarium sp. NRRL 66182]|nr:hypothetical protein F66182_6653 [Fusarium sp. NRRL 66182]
MERSPFIGSPSWLMERFDRALALFAEERMEEAEKAATELLLEPLLGQYHQAGMHLVLAALNRDREENLENSLRKLYDLRTQDHPREVKEGVEKSIKTAESVRKTLVGEEVSGVMKDSNNKIKNVDTNTETNTDTETDTNTHTEDDSVTDTLTNLCLNDWL